jgi:hypothetical protein
MAALPAPELSDGWFMRPPGIVSAQAVGDWLPADPDTAGMSLSGA